MLTSEAIGSSAPQASPRQTSKRRSEVIGQSNPLLFPRRRRCLPPSWKEKVTDNFYAETKENDTNYFRNDRTTDVPQRQQVRPASRAKKQEKRHVSRPLKITRKLSLPPNFVSVSHLSLSPSSSPLRRRGGGGGQRHSTTASEQKEACSIPRSRSVIPALPPPPPPPPALQPSPLFHKPVKCAVD